MFGLRSNWLKHELSATQRKSCQGLGEDPPAEQTEAQAAVSGVYKFETITCEWHSSSKSWSDDRSSRGLRYLELYIFSHIGITDIHPAQNQLPVSPDQKIDAVGKHDVAQRLQQRVTSTTRSAGHNYDIESNPDIDMVGALSTTKTRHYPGFTLQPLF